MYGAILGDMIGAPYEFDRGGKTKDFPIFTKQSQFTDDSVMTVAVAEALLDTPGGSGKEEIRDYILREFGYDLSRSCDEIRPGYHHVESCQQTVPEAITAFLEGTDFEDVIRTAVSLGGDCDTLTCIAGSMAEAFYGIHEELISECRNRLPEDMRAVLYRFSKIISLCRRPTTSAAGGIESQKRAENRT